MSNFKNVECAASALQSGQMIVIVDDNDRENEGDLVIAGQFAKPEAINFMATHGRGLICLALDASFTERGTLSHGQEQ